MIRPIIALALVSAVASCGEAVPGGEDEEVTPFTAMEPPCIALAAQLTERPERAVRIVDRSLVEGVALLTMDVGQTRLTCRRGDDQVTIFSPFAGREAPPAEAG